MPNTKSANDKISSGLTVRLGENKQLTGGPITVKDFANLSALALSLTKKLNKITARLRADIAAEKEQADAKLDSETRPVNGGEPMPAELRTQLKRHIQSQSNAHFRTVIENSEPERGEIIAELRQLHAMADQNRELIRSPLQLITVRYIGDEKMGLMLNQISTLGPVALSNVAVQATAAGDMRLAAACIMRNDGFNPDQRKLSFSSQSLADSVMASEYEAGMNSLGIIDQSYSYAMADNSALIKNEPIPPEFKISHAILYADVDPSKVEIEENQGRKSKETRFKNVLDTSSKAPSETLDSYFDRIEGQIQRGEDVV